MQRAQTCTQQETLWNISSPHAGLSSWSLVCGHGAGQAIVGGGSTAKPRQCQPHNLPSSSTSREGMKQELLLPTRVVHCSSCSPHCRLPFPEPPLLICWTLAMGSLKVDEAGKEGGQSQELGRAKWVLLLPSSLPGSLNSLPRGRGGGDQVLGYSHGSSSEEEGTGQRGTKPPPISPTCTANGPRKQSKMLSNKAPLLN